MLVLLTHVRKKCKEINGVDKVGVCLIQRVRLVQVLLSCKVSYILELEIRKDGDARSAQELVLNVTEEEIQ